MIRLKIDCTLNTGHIYTYSPYIIIIIIIIMGSEGFGVVPVP
jgi:hypothetical protein